MEPTEPTIDLILSQADAEATCFVCEQHRTRIRCDSCEPSHPLCRDCIAPHRDDFNHVLG